MLNTLLTQLGLNEKEIKIYHSLLRLGGSSASQVALEVGLPRQTTYSLLLAMLEKEVIEQGAKRGVKQFFANPNDLFLILDKQRKQIEKNRKLLEEEIETLERLQKKNRSLPKVQYYEGQDGLKRLVQSILEVYKKGNTTEFRGYGVNKFADAIDQSYMNEFIRERAALGVKTKLFIGKGDDDFNITNKDNAYGRTIKRIDIEPQRSAIYLVENRIYLFSYEDNVGVMIENPAMVKFLKDVFDSQWKMVK